MLPISSEDPYWREASHWTKCLGPKVHIIDDIAHRKLRNKVRNNYSKTLFFTAVALTIVTIAILLSKFSFCLLAIPVALLALKFFLDARQAEAKDLNDCKLSQAVHFRRELLALNLPLLPPEGASPAVIQEAVNSHQIIIQNFIERWGRAFPQNLRVFTDALNGIELKSPSEQLNCLRACHLPRAM